MGLAQQVFRQIFDDPPADHGVIGDDQNGDDGIDPAAEAQSRLVPKGFVGAHRAFSGHAADGGFSNDHRVAKGHGQNNVYQQKNTAAVLSGQIGEAPDVSQTDGRTRSGKNETDLAGKGAPLMLTVIHDNLLSLCYCNFFNVS